MRNWVTWVQAALNPSRISTIRELATGPAPNPCSRPRDFNCCVCPNLSTSVMDRESTFWRSSSTRDLFKKKKTKRTEESELPRSRNGSNDFCTFSKGRVPALQNKSLAPGLATPWVSGLGHKPNPAPTTLTLTVLPQQAIFAQSPTVRFRSLHRKLEQLKPQIRGGSRDWFR